MSYYKTIDGKKFDGHLMEMAEEAVGLTVLMKGFGTTYHSGQRRTSAKLIMN